MYLVNSKRRLELLLLKELTKLFGKNARVTLNNSKITIRINEGYGRIEKKLTQEQLDSNVCGGGVEMPLNGKRFRLTIEEI